MTDVVAIKPGMPVYDAAGHKVGSLEHIDQEAIRVAGHSVPLAAVAQIAPDGIFLATTLAGTDAEAGSPAARASAAGATSAAAGRAEHAEHGAQVAHPDASRVEISRPSDEVHVPLAGERLVVETRPATLGEVTIHKRVEQVEQVLRHPVERDEVEVERVAVNQIVDSPPQLRHEGEWVIIPVVEEQLVVEKRLVLKEEVRVRTRRVTEQHEFRGIVTRERIDIADPGGWVAQAEPAAQAENPSPSSPPPGQPATPGQPARPAPAWPGQAQQARHLERPGPNPSLSER
jgi:uncharacterized protein (TIGR02271 family)